jgi:uroporphyrin-3 C-methyltransferase
MSTPPIQEETAPEAVTKKSKRHTYSAILVLLTITFASSLYVTQRSCQLQIVGVKEQQTQIMKLCHDATKTMSENDDTLKAQLSNLDKQLQTSLKQQGHQTDASLFLKVRYYLELAQINAQWSDTPEITQALLQQADMLLVTSHDPRVVDIRKAIAEEMLQLKAIPTLDITGILSQLDASVDEINTLVLKSPLSAMPKEKMPTASTPNASEWREHLQQSINVLKTLIVIRRQDENVQPLPSPDDEAILRNRIKIYLQDAQWAVIKHNNTLYQWALSQTIKHIKESFSMNDPKTKVLVTQLETLQKTPLTPEKMNLTRSLPLLNQLIEKSS